MSSLPPSHPLQPRQIASRFSPNSPAFLFSSNRLDEPNKTHAFIKLEKSPRLAIKLNKPMAPFSESAGGKACQHCDDVRDPSILIATDQVRELLNSYCYRAILGSQPLDL
jgi:hypothetical protein